MTPEELRRLADVAAQVLRDMQAQDVLLEWQTLLDDALREYAASLEQQKSPEELGYVPLSDDGRSVFIDGMGEVRLAIDSPGQEPDAFMWQHEETGRTGFVDLWQVENNWQENNPRLKIIGPLFTHPPRSEPPKMAAVDVWTAHSEFFGNNPLADSDDWHEHLQDIRDKQWRG